MSSIFDGGDRIATIDLASGNFQTMPTFTDVQMSIMPLIHRFGDEFRGVGTCFAISNQGICLTARHVIDEAFPALRGGQMGAEHGELYALYIGPPQGPDPDSPLFGGPLLVDKVHVSPDLDIAALSLRMMSNIETGEPIKMPACPLGIAPPAVGATCLAVGYHKMVWAKEDALVTVEQAFAATRGDVEELHIPRRDSSQLTFPCFRTSAHYAGGMSGAPVFSEDGYVRGVVCSEIETGENDDYISYASLIGPSLLLILEGSDGPGQPAGQRFLADFAAGGAVRADLTGAQLRRDETACTVVIGGAAIRNQLPATA